MLPRTRFVVLISADGEWQAVLHHTLPSIQHPTPYGNWFSQNIVHFSVIFMHAGWGKVSTAGACQFAIDAFQPQLMVNLGTCGGLEGLAELGEILCVSETAFYDIFEGMADYAQAIEFYSSKADLSWLPEELPEHTHRARLVSADQDIQPRAYERLTQEFGAVAADWESAAFAWVARRNGIPWLILRGVSDLVSPTKAETAGNLSLWQARTDQIMEDLLNQLPWYLVRFAEKHSS
ncbi:MAG TPA: 5'-methylthioadenosine/S-adenosylhomocysteine nucleosidase [Anaerolineaceae bacterium]|nr:5'-methylthioadenosine/S-adenosylhomocysteine nucleosidase [Anaerolineaceae bacterium]